MRDLVLKEALRTLAADSALCLRALLSAGEEIPYDVAEPGGDSPLVQYRPQTARFIRDNAQVLTDLDSFGAACAAFDSSGLAAEYLLEMGVTPPAEPRRRAQLAGVVFTCRLWQSSTDFTLDEERLEATIDEVTALAETREGGLEVIVPLRGFQMPNERLELSGVSIVRADTVEVPAEAQAADGVGHAGWEPVYLGVVRIEPVAGDEDGSQAGNRAVTAFQRLITTMRLFKSGGVALGPYAWARGGGDRWRRIATGAGRPRPGGYRLTEHELADLAGFSRSLCGSATPFYRAEVDRPGFLGALARSISRFEAGCERRHPAESLNDHLLALRFMLEGDGPAGLGLSMRVAALCAEAPDRAQVKRVVDDALDCERELWSGETTIGEAPLAADIADELEELTRAILKDASCGLLGNDLRSTADEILLSDGLAGAGSGDDLDQGETDEWSALRARAETTEISSPAASKREPEFEPAPIGRDMTNGAAVRPAPDAEEAADPMRPASPLFDTEIQAHRRIFDDVEGLEADLRAVEQAAPRPIAMSEPGESELHSDLDPEPAERDIEYSNVRRLHAVPSGSAAVDELMADSQQHQREVTSRVSFLFPRPETCEWRVPEVGYDRTRRADVSEMLPGAS